MTNSLKPQSSSLPFWLDSRDNMTNPPTSQPKTPIWQGSSVNMTNPTPFTKAEKTLYPSSNDSVSNAAYYSDALSTTLCERLANSTDTLAEICSAPEMPSINSVYRWRRTHPHFKEQLE